MEEKEEIKEIEIKRGKNPLIVDGSLSRIGFFKTFLFICIAFVIFMIAIIPIHFAIPIAKRDIVVNIIALIFASSLLYIMIIASMKRLYDITYNKGKSIFYIIAFIIFCFLIANFIPELNMLRILLSIVMLAIFLFLPTGFLQKYFK